MRFISLLLTLVLLSACAGQTKSLSSQSVDHIKGKAVYFSPPEDDFFVGIHSSKSPAAALGAFGAVGGLVSGLNVVSKGKEFVRENNITNEANLIRDELMASLVKKYDVESGSIHNGDILLEYSGSNALVRQTNPFKDLHYVQLISKMLIRDLSNNQVLAEHTCNIGKEANERELTIDEVYANNAKEFKKIYGQKVNKCIAEFKASLLG